MRFAFDPASGEVWDALHTATRQRVQCRECCSGCVWVRAPADHRPHFRHIAANPECSLSICADELQEGGDVDAQRRGGQTPWHKAWSASVRPECREMQLRDRPRDAALVADDCIVEFQHSALSSEEFARRCAAPVRQAVWIFDVTDHVVNKCKDSTFLILPTPLACDYAAEAECILLWQVKDGSLYESISKPYGIRQNRTNCIARDVRPWTRRLPDVFTDDVLSAEGRAWNARRAPPEWISVWRLTCGPGAAKEEEGPWITKRSLRDLAAEMGYLFLQSRYDNDSHKEVQTAARGKYLQDTWTWTTRPDEDDDVENRAMTWKDFQRRHRCLRCERDHEAPRGRPFCRKCYMIIKRSEETDEEEEWVEVSPVERKRLLAKYKWLHLVPLSSGSGTPCQTCGLRAYSPVWWFGNRALCSDCLESGSSRPPQKARITFDFEDESIEAPVVPVLNETAEAARITLEL